MTNEEIRAIVSDPEFRLFLDRLKILRWWLEPRIVDDDAFRTDPVLFFVKADDRTQALIWAEIERWAGYVPRMRRNWGGACG